MTNSFTPGSSLETAAVIIAISISCFVTVIIAPSIMKKMRERGITGIDWNKKNKVEIPELGGIALLFGFPVGISIATGVLKLFDSFISTPILAAIGALFIGGMIGIIDDISDIPQRIKALLLSFAALPVIVAGFGDENIILPFGYSLDFTVSSELILVYWLIIVPLGITGAANAINMSAGYNGLETGQIVIISLCLLICAMITQSPIESVLIFSGIMGAALGLNYFNGYPAVTFVGDVGTLSMGAVIGAGAIIGGLELAGLIAIFPAFFEAFSTGYHSFIKKVDRKVACTKPIIDEKGYLHTPEGAKYFTLAYLILSKRSMTERNLVRCILGIYAIFGTLAIIISAL